MLRHFVSKKFEVHYEKLDFDSTLFTKIQILIDR